MRSRRNPLLVAVVALAVLLTAACSGVPRSSAPEVVRSVSGGQDPGNVDPGPAPGTDPRTVLTGFLQAAVVNRSASKQYLTSDAQRKWQDSSVIVVQDDYRVPAAEPQGNTATFTVTAHRVGQLDATGAYTPVLKGDGYGDAETFTFGLLKVAGQWRIDQLQAGVLVTQTQFTNSFKPRTLYFFDTAETQLVPDVRYSSLSDQPLATWMLQQMLTGPRPELTSTVVNEIPDQAASGHPAITLGNQMTVEIPGASEIDSGGRQRLAVQLAYTLTQVQVSQIEITDSGRPVAIGSTGTSFSVADFPGLGPDSFSSEVLRYYLSGSPGSVGALMSVSTGKAVAGSLGGAGTGVQSIALHQDGNVLRVAALVGLPGSTASSPLGGPNARLEVGDTTEGLAKIVLPPGLLSRPDWRPQSNEVWLGVGRTGAIYRVQNGTAKVVVSASLRGAAPAGQITALRFSPEGDRIAVVVAAPDGTSTVWVGSVVRSGTDVRIDGFEPVTPAALKVADVGWVGGSLLTLLASDSARGLMENSVWSMQSDGSSLELRSTTGLPSAPQTLATAPGQLLMVGAGGTVWLGSSGGWTSLDGGGLTYGTAPVYALS